MDHEQSPVSSFFSERTSLRFLVPCLLSGLNTLSNTWKSVRRSWRQRYHGPYASSRKSSTNTSTYANSFALGCRRYGLRVNLVCSFSRGGAGGGATASAHLSSLWGLLGWWERRDSFARSATIYVAVQNKGGGGVLVHRQHEGGGRYWLFIGAAREDQA